MHEIRLAGDNIEFSFIYIYYTDICVVCKLRMLRNDFMNCL